LKELAEDFPIIEDVRGRGLMFGFQLGEEHAHLGEPIQEKLVEKGFLMDFHGSSRTFRFFPYVITHDEIDSFMAALRETLTSFE